MKQSLVFIGLLAGIFQSANGLVFRDKIKSEVDGNLFTLLHGVETPTSLKFDPSTLDGKDSWEFNTEGFPDDTAIIKALGTDDQTISCDPSDVCKINIGGEPQPFQITRIVQQIPIFTFKDTKTGYYVTRSSDLSLRLSPNFDPTAVFTLAKIEAHEEM